MNNTFEAIRQDRHQRKIARARKGWYKPLIEELWPLGQYFEKEYPEAGYRLKFQLGNQEFDAVVCGRFGGW